MDGWKEVAVYIVGSGVAGSVLTLAVKWGFNLKGLSALGKSHDTLKGRFMSHETNTAIHRDPDRDPDRDRELKKHIDKGFEAVRGQLNSIEGRCEQRGKDCANHFGSIEKKIAFSNGVREAEKKKGDPRLVTISEVEG